MDGALRQEDRTVVAQALRSWLTRPDLLVALAGTALIVLLHGCFSPGVGGLWRDEINTLNLATLPTWANLWEFHNQDSFPLLFAALLRSWSGIFGASDDSLRFLGLLIGLGVVGALWINARLLGLIFPFWSLALVGANPLIIRYGDSMRAYGLGLMLLLLMFGSLWKLTQSLQTQWFIVATITSVLAVHALYYNAVLLFAICMGGCAVAWRQKQWRTAMAVLGVGLIAAVSLLPYLPTFLHANDWNFLVQYPFTLAWMWSRLQEVIGSPNWIGICIWLALLLTTLVVGSLTMFSRKANPPASRERATFCVVALVVGVVAYTGFLKLLSYYTQAWYYIALLTIASVCIDPILSPGKNRVHRIARAVAVAFFLALTALPSSRIISLRHTNLDFVASALHVMAAPDDFVLVTRWECGVTMNRYYKGPAAWATIPPLTDFRFQAYQPVMEHMRAADPLRSIMERAEQTLRSGHKVWLVGEAPAPPLGEAAPTLPRVVDSTSKWRGSALFYKIWVMQVTGFLTSHMVHATNLSRASIDPVSDFENLPVQVLEGWK
jgi:Dolichyl-phosphate-mannose-protein mannosyltransferase